jgi:signal transduction histidine kinase
LSAAPGPGAPEVVADRRQSPATTLRAAVIAFRGLEGAELVWLAVRESRSRAAVIRCVEGTRSTRALGFRVEPGAGIGGGVMLNGLPWRGSTRSETDGTSLSSDEQTLLHDEGATAVMVVPLRRDALGGGEPRLEGLAFVANRDGRTFSDGVLSEAMALGERLARSIRDAQRLTDAIGRWERVGRDSDGPDVTPDQRLEELAHVIAMDVRILLRSPLAIVFRLDRTSGALHSLGVDGVDVPAVRRGQVLPPGCGTAGAAVARRAVVVAHQYDGDSVQVPPILSDALPALVAFTTMSAPLIAGDEVIGAVTVARPNQMPYDADDARLAEHIVAEAAPVLGRAQQASESARRQQGAWELSRLAGSLTQSLGESAIRERLAQSVISLVNGAEAAVWDQHGHSTLTSHGSAGILGDPRDIRLQRILDRVMATQQPFWTPDFGNDPRLAEPGPGATPRAAGARAVLAVPIRLRDTLLAVLAVTGATGRPFTPADVELVQALCDQAALAIANAQAYRALQVSRAAVLQHEKLVAMGRLAAGLAHELRNPLQNAVGCIAELRDLSRAETLRACSEFADFPPFLKQAHAEMQRAAGLVDRLLDYVRERQPSLESVDVRQTVDEAVALVATAAARHGKRITVASPDTPLRVRADPVMLKQVVLNVLTNALDALDGPGHVDVDVHLQLGSTGAGRVTLTVRDTGRGIAPDHLPKVFDPFFTTKEVGKGVGLGLALCQAMIEQHRGSIAVTSAGVGQGATVLVELPAEP